MLVTTSFKAISTTMNQLQTALRPLSTYLATSSNCCSVR